jgi:hypothetical protein
MSAKTGSTLLVCTLLLAMLLAACRGESSDIPAEEAQPNGPVPTVAPTPETMRPGTVRLQGSVRDDTLPHGPLVVWWSQVSGPGPVYFDDITQPDTIATFTVPGEYVLRLTANDGEWVVTDDVTITVLP